MLVLINEVNLRWSQLVVGWVTVSGFDSCPGWAIHSLSLVTKTKPNPKSRWTPPTAIQMPCGRHPDATQISCGRRLDQLRLESVPDLRPAQITTKLVIMSVRCSDTFCNVLLYKFRHNETRHYFSHFFHARFACDTYWACNLCAIYSFLNVQQI